MFLTFFNIFMRPTREHSLSMLIKLFLAHKGQTTFHVASFRWLSKWMHPSASHSLHIYINIFIYIRNQLGSINFTLDKKYPITTCHVESALSLFLSNGQPCANNIMWLVGRAVTRGPQVMVIVGLMGWAIINARILESFNLPLITPHFMRFCMRDKVGEERSSSSSTYAFALLNFV